MRTEEVTKWAVVQPSRLSYKSMTRQFTSLPGRRCFQLVLHRGTGGAPLLSRSFLLKRFMLQFSLTANTRRQEAILHSKFHNESPGRLWMNDKTATARALSVECLFLKEDSFPSYLAPVNDVYSLLPGSDIQTCVCVCLCARVWWGVGGCLGGILYYLTCRWERSVIINLHKVGVILLNTLFMLTAPFGLWNRTLSSFGTTIFFFSKFCVVVFLHILGGWVQLFHSLFNYAIRWYLHKLCLPCFKRQLCNFPSAFHIFQKITERWNTGELFWTFFSLYLDIKKIEWAWVTGTETIQNCYKKRSHCRLREATVLQFRRRRKQTIVQNKRQQYFEGRHMTASSLLSLHSHFLSEVYPPPTGSNWTTTCTSNSFLWPGRTAAVGEQTGRNLW